MEAARRLADSRVDPRVRVRFTFDGRRFEGCKGDTLASALLANGVAIVGRSWKYHRPRGIYTSGVEEPNAIIQLESGAFAVPNARATEVELYEGLVAQSVSGWPSARHDLMSVAGVASRLLPAGFYYKTFMWPQRWWPRYERYIREASGLGSAPQVRDANYYDKTFAHCDVLVAGGGPAGLAAALAAGRAGARVILAEQQPELGGALLNLRDAGDTWTARLPGVSASSADQWVREVSRELATIEEVRVLTRSTVFGYHDHNFLTINERLTDHLPLGERYGVRERVWRVRARQVVLATGAIERPIVFGNNDRPGVMLASAVSAYVNRYGVKLGSRAVVFTNNDAAYRSALDLKRAGVEVAAVVDCRSNCHGRSSRRAREAGVAVIENAVVVDVKGTRRVRAVVVASLGADGATLAGGVRTITCDLLAVSGGFSPVVHLSAQSGARPTFDETRACFVPGSAVQAESSAGACNGIFSTDACIAEGFGAGARAAAHAGFGSGATEVAAVEAATDPIRPLWIVPSKETVARAPKQFVDLQNDVTAADIALAAREGYRSIEHVKRYTALGFGTDQGKLGNVNGAAILAGVLGNDIASTGTTTFRPNYTPVSFGAIAGPDLGDLFEPIRKTALHEWHAEHGAPFENVGQWKRPWYYPRAGESMEQAVNRECLAARGSVAMMDASTLGKIDIRGPDAVMLLNWVYTNAWSKLGVGRARYGLMLDENGMVMDDGVTTRLADDHFLMTTTTGGAARVMAWLERWLQTEWPHLRVYLTSVTDHWATTAVAGPMSRKVVAAVCHDIDFSPASFPFMSVKEGTVAGVEARVVRISFSGELAYEVNVSANAARHVWEALLHAGAPYDITPYGTETMHVLRAEKGFIIVGQDTDGSVTPLDLGMDWIVAKGKDFIGRRSLARSDTARADRKQLVGLLTERADEVLPEGGQIVENGVAARRMQGHVTSSYFSANLDRSIALALIENGRARMGESVQVAIGEGRFTRARIASPVFVDPEGTRQNV